MQVDSAIAPWAVGPPAPRLLSTFVRILQLLFFTVALWWVFGYIGGVGFSPLETGEGSNDTSSVFNWHVICMTLAFPILMGEAVMAYKSPLLASKSRDERKLYHFTLQVAASVCIILGLIAAFQSHNLKLPTPIPNLYSTHSVLGMLVVCLFTLQIALGFSAYISPKWSAPHKRALGPVHGFLGLSIFIIGLTTMAVGIQEKTTFIQAFSKPASVFDGVMRIPCLMQVLLMLIGMSVLYHHTPSAHARQRHQQIDGLEAQPLVTS